MLIAHLPSGYILAHFAKKQIAKKMVLATAIAGAIAPDFDMLYFHFVDMGRTHHHYYPTHWPLFWIAIIAPIILIFHISSRLHWRNLAGVFLAGAMIHMALDSIASPMFWFKPFGEGVVELVKIPALYEHWVLSFIFHWTFALELIIWLTAIYIHINIPKPARS